MNMSDTREYVLGTNPEELERLGMQHRLWSDFAHAAWKRAGIAPGHRVLDVGCGPGYATFDLAQTVRPLGTRPRGDGQVVAVDESAYYIEHLRAQAASRGLTNIRAHVGDVQRLGECADVREGSFDLAYARWVLCFVRDPGAVIAGMARALGPGGRAVVHDYFNYESMTSAPRSVSFAMAVAATARSWRDAGGNPDVCERVPEMMATAGLEVSSVLVEERVARPHESMWTWPDVWWKAYIPVLVRNGYLTHTDQEIFEKEWAGLCESATSFVVCPPVFEIVGVKR